MKSIPMSELVGKALYLNSLGLNRNVDKQAANQRAMYNGQLRKQPVDANTKAVQAENAKLKAEIQRLKQQSKP